MTKPVNGACGYTAPGSRSQTPSLPLRESLGHSVTIPFARTPTPDRAGALLKGSGGPAWIFDATNTVLAVKTLRCSRFAFLYSPGRLRRVLTAACGVAPRKRRQSA